MNVVVYSVDGIEVANSTKDDPAICKALYLFFFPDFPGPTFISCPTSIPESRVSRQ